MALMIILTSLFVRLMFGETPVQDAPVRLEIEIPQRGTWTAECVTGSEGICEFDITALNGMKGLIRGKLIIEGYGKQDILFYAGDEPVYVINLNSAIHTEDKPYEEVPTPTVTSVVASSTVMADQQNSEISPNKPAFPYWVPGILFFITTSLILILYNKFYKGR